MPMHRDFRCKKCYCLKFSCAILVPLAWYWQVLCGKKQNKSTDTYEIRLFPHSTEHCLEPIHASDNRMSMHMHEIQHIAYINVTYFSRVSLLGCKTRGGKEKWYNNVHNDGASYVILWAFLPHSLPLPEFPSK